MPKAAALPGQRARCMARLPLLGLLGLVLAVPASAQYKVIGADGSVTYTDRTPLDSSAKVQAMRRDGSLAATTPATTPPTAPAAGTPASTAPVALPFELRAVVARFPVVLYTTNQDCSPCLQARNLLTQRGVPYSERSISSDEDIGTLQRLTGGRSVPALTVGAQALRGLQEQDWQSTLDLAGYPKESRLPRGWQAAPISPLVALKGPGRASGESITITITGEPPAKAGSQAAATPLPAASAGIRF